MKYPAIIISALTLMALACNNTSDEQRKDTSEPVKTGITEKALGAVDGQAITEYTLTNASGMQAGIMNYGATVTKLITPDRDHKMGDVILGYDSLSGFLQKANPYFGALVGRYANRIANARFALNGKTYTLAANDHGNSLHGGNKGFDKVVWQAEKRPGDSSLKLVYRSHDGEEGYPGNVTATVIYTLTGDDALRIDYTATTDQATPLNLTSHCYFNLSAGKDATILNHQLTINANQYTPVNDKLIPTGQMAEVKNTPMDFTRSKSVGKDIDSVKGGFDHNWILNKSGDELSMAAKVYDSNSGRDMSVWTTEPGLQFYSGNFLDGTLTNTKGGNKYVQHAALCLEAQHFPDSPNEPSFPNTFLKPGDTYRQTTIYKFSIR